MAALFQRRCLYVDCGCGWSKSLAIGTGNMTETQVRDILTNSVRSHMAAAPRMPARMQDPVRRSWHKTHLDAVPPPVHRGVSLECKLCGYRSDPCTTLGEITDCTAEHLTTIAHQTNESTQRLTREIARALRVDAPRDSPT